MKTTIFFGLIIILIMNFIYNIDNDDNDND